MRLRKLTSSVTSSGTFSSASFVLAACLGLALLTGCGQPEEPADSPEIASTASALISFPTKWTLINKTRQTLTFTCSCPKPRGLVNPINMATTTVPVGGTKVVNWGDWWYNDGLGLNACTWSCSAKSVAGVYASVTFNTDWGENITLRAKSTGGLAVER